MRINRKRTLDEKSFRLRYLEKKPVKDNLDDFGLKLKQKLNDLQRASNRRFDYTTQKLISEITRKIDGNMSTKAIKDVIEKTENVINKIPDYNDKMADIKDEIHDLLDDCKLTLNKNNTTTIPDTASVLPRYVFTEENYDGRYINEDILDAVWRGLDSLNVRLKVMAVDEYYFNHDDHQGNVLEDLACFRINSYNWKRGDYISNDHYFEFPELNDKNREYILGKLKEIADKYGLKETKRRSNAVDSKKMKDEFISHDADYRVGDWTDVLRIYLEWNGIIGYDSIIEDYLKNKDFDGLREYFEDEGIYGYADDIIDIYENGEINIPDMSREDYDAFFK